MTRTPGFVALAPAGSGSEQHLQAPEHLRFGGFSADLLALAESGEGMTEIADRCYGGGDWNLLRAAVHESGHAAVGQAYGLQTSIEITEQLGGNCQLQGRALLLAEVRRQIGLAGEIAYHHAVYGLWAPDAVIYRHATSGAMNAVDQAFAGDFTLEHVSETAALVRELWPEIIGQAEAIIETELVKRGAA